MAVTEEDVRKALEDMLYANLIEIFNAKYGEELLWAGVDLSVAFEAPPYDSAEDYTINIIEAVDVDGIDIRNAIEVKNVTATGFTMNSPRNTTAKWQTTRRTPKITFHTP